MKTRALRSLAVTLFALSLAGSALAANPQSGFVKVEGKHFTLDGKPYYFAGANVWYGMYLGSPGKTGDRARLTKELDQLASEGVSNLRVLAISEASTLKRAVTPSLMLRPITSMKHSGRASISCSTRWRSAT